MVKLFYSKPRWPKGMAYSSGWWSAALMITVLFAAGCRTSNRSTSKSTSGLLDWNRKVNVTLATLPSSLAEIAIPADSLRRLPSGAVFTNRVGQATAVVTLKGDTLIVRAHCDSLQALTYELEEQLRQAHDELEQQQIIKTPVTLSLWAKLTWYVAGIITIVFIFLLIKLHKNYGKTSR